MRDPPKWMYPEGWFDNYENIRKPEAVDVKLQGDFDEDQRSYSQIESMLENVVIDDRPDFLSTWYQVTPLAGSDAPPYAEHDENVDFDAREAFYYCYRAKLRIGAIYLLHSLTNGNHENWTPWSPHAYEPDEYEHPSDLFEMVLEGTSMPFTRFKYKSGEPYEDVETLFDAITTSDKILLKSNDRTVVTTRKQYIAPKRERKDE